MIAFVNSNRLRIGDEIPPAKQLAALAGVSFVTMLKALNLLKGQRLLSGVAGHPFRVSGILDTPHKPESSESTPLQRPAAQVTAWRRTREKITHDILDGAFASGTDLPSVKELCTRYGVSWAPLKKALDSLHQDGIIQRRRRRYAVPVFSAPARHSRIILLTHSFDSFTMYLGQHDEELFKSLERMCAHARIVLDVYLIFPESLTPKVDPPPQLLRERRTGRVLPFESIGRLDDPVVLGYIFVAPGPSGGTEERILPLLARSRKPAAVLAEAGGWTLPREVTRSGNVQLFSLASSDGPARSLARYLLAQCHRRIAYISPYHQFPWSQRRLEGLHAAISPTEPDSRLCVYTSENDPLLGEAPVDVVNFFESRRGALPQAHAMEYDALLKRIREFVTPQVRTREALHVLLDQALAEDKEITAWVMVNDQTACLALEYLEAKGLSVPQDLSVVSFDDSRDALRMNLTSYNFNASGAASAMMGFVLNRRPFSDIGKSGVLGIEGYIAERQTVAQLPVRA